jgi:hypothetical protein
VIKSKKVIDELLKNFAQERRRLKVVTKAIVGEECYGRTRVRRNKAL